MALRHYALLALLPLTACHKAEVAHYRVPKETPSAAAQIAATPPAVAGEIASPVPQTAELHWTAPEHWQPQPLSAMRRASFAIASADGAPGDVSVVMLAGTAGGWLDNVNRWRGQLGLPAQTSAQLDSTTQLVKTSAGLEFTVVDLPGDTEHILGAMLTHADASWFFKLRGPAALVAREKPAFLAFLQTVRTP